MPKNLALRSARRGKGLLPPNPKRWEHEHNGLDLRYELNLSNDDRLSERAAFELLPDVRVLSHKELNLSTAHMELFSGANSGKWSGMCVPCPDGDVAVIYNGYHPIRRIRATLMEEFFHLWLDHRPTHLRLLSNGHGGRDYDGDIESEAYGSGAAALVPYKALRAMIEAGHSKRAIADHFQVSEQLIEFRMRVARLFRRSR